MSVNDPTPRRSPARWLASLILSLILPTAFLFLAFALCGVGHGDCRLMILFPALLPYSAVCAELLPNTPLLFVPLALLQFPAYVLLIWRSGPDAARKVMTGLFAAHVLTSVIAYSFFM